MPLLILRDAAGEARHRYAFRNLFRAHSACKVVRSQLAGHSPKLLVLSDHLSERGFNVGAEGITSADVVDDDQGRDAEPEAGPDHRERASGAHLDS